MAFRLHFRRDMPSTSKFALSTTALVFSILSAGAAGAESLTNEEQELVGLINQTRRDAGLQPLQADAGLSAVARAHSLDMAITGFFSHSSPSTGDMGDRLSGAGIDFRAAGENIALNSDVRSAHSSLMQSPAHRQNLMSHEVTHLGVGVVSNGRMLLVTEVFLRPGPRFTARIPTIDPVVAEASPNDVRVVPVQPQLPQQQFPQQFPAQEGCEGGWDEEYDEEGVDVQAFAPNTPPVTIVPPDRLPAAQQIPTLQVRPMPMPTPTPHAPNIGRGFWILGPRGNWVQVRIQPMPIQRRAIPQTRFLY